MKEKENHPKNKDPHARKMKAILLDAKEKYN